jgi:hypothetical protein
MITIVRRLRLLARPGCTGARGWWCHRLSRRHLYHENGPASLASPLGLAGTVGGHLGWRKGDRPIESLLPVLDFR